jgi:plasmid stability protein
MGERVTLELPDELAMRARALATRTHRRLEDVLVDWLDRAAIEPPVESLPDAELLALCDIELSPQQQAELDELLAHNREGQLDEKGRAQLDSLMQVYRRGLVRKAEAIKVAVERGLRPPLT